MKTRCRGLALILMLFFTFLAGKEINTDEYSKSIQSYIFAGEFKKAEPLVKKCLKQSPGDLYFLSQLDIVYNGCKKYRKADQIRDRIREIWNREHKAAWLAKGAPVAESAWARIIVPAADYYVVGAEYYQPEVIGTQYPITTFFKIIAMSREKMNSRRVFKLEMSKLDQEFYILREILDFGGGRQVIQYGTQKPDFRRLVTDAVAFLANENQKN